MQNPVGGRTFKFGKGRGIVFCMPGHAHALQGVILVKHFFNVCEPSRLYLSPAFVPFSNILKDE